jgi:hypothetical protein
MNFFALRSDIILPWLYSGGMELSNNLGLHGLLPLEQRLLPGLHQRLHLAHIVLHFLDEDIDFGNNLHGLSNE